MQRKHLIPIACGIVAWLSFQTIQSLCKEYADIKQRLSASEEKITEESTRTLAAIRAFAESLQEITDRLFRAEQAVNSQVESKLPATDIMQTMRDELQQELTSKLASMTCPPPQTVDLSPIEERLTALEAKLLALVPTEKPKENTTVSPIEKPRIVMHAGENCPPCKLWKANELPKWIKAGWEFDVLDETVSQKRWPWFEVYGVTAEPFEVEGYMTRDVFEAAKARVTK